MKRILEQPKFLNVDRRLLGTWKSDRLRTLKEWNWIKRLSLQKKKRFQALFGKLEITYTRTRVVFLLRHRKWEQSRRYELVAADENSVAIVSFGKMRIKNRRNYDPANLKFLDESLWSKPRIQHIHFEKNHYWISLGNGRNREFFRKIRP